MARVKQLRVKGATIGTLITNEIDYISLTDIARQKNAFEPKDVVKNWFRLKNTLEYLGLWEFLNNPGFKGVEFDPLLKEAGNNAFTMSPSRWIQLTGAIGVITKSGVGGGTYAQRDIAFKFAGWVSVEFELYLIKEFQRLKEEENNRLQLDWNLQRTLAKVNYQIHTDAIKENIIPREITKLQASFVYASEADLLNVALFGITAKEWRENNPDQNGNIRDFASLEQLVVLSNMESINALLIRQGSPQSERLLQLNKVAITQMKSLLANNSLRKLR